MVEKFGIDEIFPRTIAVEENSHPLPIRNTKNLQSDTLTIPFFDQHGLEIDIFEHSPGNIIFNSPDSDVPMLRDLSWLDDKFSDISDDLNLLHGIQGSRMVL